MRASAPGQVVAAIILLSTALLGLWISPAARGQAGTARDSIRPDSLGAESQAGCTVVYAADGTSALGGNNEDFRNPLTKIWFIPGEDEAYGSAFVGYDDLVVQGAMNEAGLFYDGLAVREVEVPAKPGKRTSTGANFTFEVLSRCESVDCVLAMYNDASMPGIWNGQALFGDRFGDSVIIEPLTTIPKSGLFQVATNFFQSEVEPAARTDPRYVTATTMLEHADHFSVELIRDVLDATHQEGAAETLYSTVYELSRGIIHLYYFHDFDTQVTFDVRAELAKGIHAYEMAGLFPENMGAGLRSAPIRQQLAERIDQLPQVAISSGPLSRLVGTYEASFVTILVATDGDSLMARQPWTPWMALAPVSEVEFIRIFSAPSGNVHEYRLTFSVDRSGNAARIQVTDDTGLAIRATRTAAADTPRDGLPAILALVGLAVAAIWLGWRRWGGRGGVRPASFVGPSVAPTGVGKPSSLPPTEKVQHARPR
jgi:hypothetical protein